MLTDIDLKGAEVVFNDLSKIQLNVPLVQQLDELKEDLLQIGNRDGIIIDVGFYPEFSEDGQFKVIAVKDQDWDTPIWEENCKSTQQLPAVIQKAIDNNM